MTKTFFQKLSYFVTGMGALLWFLIRVIPKPSRATYPCQRVVFPLASSFVVWLIGLIGTAVAFHKAKYYFVRSRYVIGAICIAVGIGAAVGIVGSLITTRVLQQILFEIEPTDPATFVTVTLFLGLVTLLACFIPAWRASRVNPVDALRAE